MDLVWTEPWGLLRPAPRGTLGLTAARAALKHVCTCTTNTPDTVLLSDSTSVLGPQRALDKVTRACWVDLGGKIPLDPRPGRCVSEELARNTASCLVMNVTFR